MRWQKNKQVGQDLPYCECNEETPRASFCQTLTNLNVQCRANYAANANKLDMPRFELSVRMIINRLQPLFNGFFAIIDNGIFFGRFAPVSGPLCQTADR